MIAPIIRGISIMLVKNDPECSTGWSGGQIQFGVFFGPWLKMEDVRRSCAFASDTKNHKQPKTYQACAVFQFAILLRYHQRGPILSRILS